MSDMTPIDIEDDGFTTLNIATFGEGAATAPAEAGEMVSPLPAPLSRTQQERAVLTSRKDEAEAELMGIESRIIALQAGTEAAERQAHSEYLQTITTAKSKLSTVLNRLGDDRDEAMAVLTASKDDILGVVAMLSAGIEAGQGGQP